MVMNDEPANAEPGSIGDENRDSGPAGDVPGRGSRRSHRRSRLGAFAGLGLSAGLLLLAALAAVGSRGLPERAADRGPAPIDITGAAVAEFVAWALVVLAIAGLIFTFWPGGTRVKLPERPAWSPIRFLVMVAIVVVVMSIFRSGLLDQEPAPEVDEPVVEQVDTSTAPSRWAIALLVGVLAATLGGLAVVGLRRSGGDEADETRPVESRPESGSDPTPEAARDLVLVAGPLRMAIIKRYGAMLQDLAQAGHARRPSEAPLEYLDRIEPEDPLVEPTRRLTRLFELAGFSARPATEAMIDDAESALRDVRRGLAGHDE
jgi:hypothetical protein